MEYIEVRCLDLDPFSPVGVNEAQIDFLDLFLLDCLLSDSPRIGDEECERLDDNYKDVVSNGRYRELKLCRAGERTPVSEAATDILAQLEPLAELLDSWRGIIPTAGPWLLSVKCWPVNGRFPPPGFWTPCAPRVWGTGNGAWKWRSSISRPSDRKVSMPRYARPLMP